MKDAITAIIFMSILVWCFMLSAEVEGLRRTDQTFADGVVNAQAFNNGQFTTLNARINSLESTAKDDKDTYEEFKVLNHTLRTMVGQLTGVKP